MAEQIEPKLWLHQRSKTKFQKMSLSLLNDAESIKNADFQSIAVYETSDISNKEQEVFCVQCVNESLFSYDNF